MTTHRQRAEGFLEAGSISGDAADDQAAALFGIGYALLALGEEQDNDLQRQLEKLTPGGSEFHENPSNCIEWIRGRLVGKAHLIKLLRNAKERANCYARGLTHIRSMARSSTRSGENGIYTRRIETVAAKALEWDEGLDTQPNELERIIASLREENAALQATMKTAASFCQASPVSELVPERLLMRVSQLLTSALTDPPEAVK